MRRWGQDGRMAGLLMAAAVLLIASLAGPAAAATISAQIDRAQIAVGESTILSIQIEGSQDASAPQVGVLDGLTARYMGPSTQMTFNNGSMSSSITHRYQVIARKAGRYDLGPFEATVGGATLRTEPVSLQVLPPGQSPDPAAPPRLGVEARLGRSDPFVGERVPLTIRALIPGGVRVDDLQFPAVEADNVAVGEMPQPTQRDERIGGRPYRVLYFDTYVTPLAASSPGGELVVAMGMSVLETRRGANRGVFGMFGDMLAERRPVELRSAPVSFAPRPLPPGQPPSFSGAVGSFDLEISASPLSVNAGDPITVRIAVNGEGDLSKVQPPQFGQIDGFRVYDPVPVKDAGEGRRVIEQVVIPQSPEADELPSLSFSFFEPRGESYRTVHRGPIALSVGAASNVAPGVVAEGESGRPERALGPLGRDLVYIKNAPGRWVGKGLSWLGSPAFWVVNAVPALVCCLLWWRNRRRDLLAANPALQRFRGADARVRAALAALAPGAAEGAGFFDELARALSEFLGAKLGLPPGAIEAASVARAMRSAGYEGALCSEAEDLLGALQGLRYAPGRASGADRGELLARVERLIAAVERRKDLTEKLAKSVSSLLAVAAFGCVIGVAVQAQDAGQRIERSTSPETAETDFFAGNHAYADGRYADAVRRYESILAGGEESGALHFNLGNAYFKSGDVPSALASYLRARRLLPRDPDVAANLSFARDSLELASDRDALWWRVGFPLAYRVSEAELAVAVTALWWLVGAAFAAGMLAPRLREPLRWPLRIGVALVLFVAANLLYRHQRLELRNDAVVVAGGGAAVRFEPSDAGTEHFEAPPGTRLTVTDQRNGWAQVARRDGRRGWVEASAITRLR